MQNTISTKNKTLNGIIFAIIGNTIWGFSFLFTRIGLQSAAPSILLATRFCIAFLLMNIPILMGRVKISFKGKKIRWLLLLGILQPTLYFLFESNGILYTNATFSGVMIALCPILSLILAMLLLGEQPSRRQKLFMLLPIIGVIIVTISEQSSGVIQPIGVIFLVGACLAGSFYIVTNRKISLDFSAYERTYIMMLIGFIVFTTMAIIEHKGNTEVLFKPFLEPSFLMSAIVLGVFCSFAAFLCVNLASSRLSVTQLSVFTSLVPLVSIIAGVAILKEPITLPSVIGMMLILVGIWNVNR